MADSKLSDGPEGCSYTQFACIGTGFSGICLGAQLQRWYNITDVRFFERQSGLGGTWHANRYPGCACDVPSALYSLSFEPNADWSRLLPPWQELLAYLDRVAAKYDLHRCMMFGVEVRKAEWIEARSRWRLTLVQLGEGGATFVHESQFLFSATGQLVPPRELDVPGKDNFRGHLWHSSQWRQDVDLTDKKVVNFGNGCTAAQVVPAIVGQAKQVTQVMRSKHWVAPHIDRLFNRAGPGAYNCTAMSGFPNLFALQGPNTLNGHTSVLMASENSCNYSLRVIKPLLDGGGTVAEVSLDAEKDYVGRIQEALSKTVLATGCGSWYVNKLDNGREWNATMYPWSSAHYWYRCLFPVWKDWQFRVSPS